LFPMTTLKMTADRADGLGSVADQTPRFTTGSHPRDRRRQLNSQLVSLAAVPTRPGIRSQPAASALRLLPKGHPRPPALAAEFEPAVPVSFGRGNPSSLRR